MRRRDDDWRCPRTVTVVLFAALLFVTTSVRLHSQASVGTRSIVLSRPLSVRSAGLNGAGAALVGSAGSVFSNPAGIATIRHVGIEGAFRSTPSEGTIAAGAVAWRIRQFDIGIGIARLKFGNNTATSLLVGVPTGEDASELAGVGSVVYRFGIIALAGSGKYVQRTVNNVRDDAVSADAGMAIALFDIMAIGFSMQNIGGRWGGESTVLMPGLTRLAMMWNYVDPLETFRLLSTVEFQWPAGEDFRLVIGGEGGVVINEVGLLGRMAYGSEPTGSAFSKMTYGGSLTLANLAFDYAYQRADLSGEPSHRFGFRLTL